MASVRGLQRLDAGDLVIAGVARHHEPSLAGAVVPELAMRPGRIVAQIDVVDEARERVRRLRVGTLHVGVAEIGELAHVALAAMGTVDPHRRSQCRLGCAPAPRSSISAPVAKRSSR